MLVVAVVDRSYSLELQFQLLLYLLLQVVGVGSWAPLHPVTMQLPQLSMRV
jgi:hypothetical protein